MDAKRWERIRALFEAAEAQPAEFRAQWIHEQAGDDEELERHVRALLSAVDETVDPVAQVLGGAAKAALETVPASLRPGERIGHYEILAELGRGGMGTVYRAVRADDAFQKEFAIKRMRPSVLNEETLLRFRGERQILADLDHPNIARMVDGGTTADGLPYVVMEFVDGVPIDEYADTQKLTVVDRLKLFLPVASAVAYAHRNLIVHRDLKPANILVTSEGVSKLLDFGIAKLLEPSLSPQTVVVTQPHLRLMTPAYASPEQVLGKPITTASDVYSLGVVLYELLAGRRPYQIETGAVGEYERAVVTQEPERPSTAVTRTALHQTSSGEQREVTPSAVCAARRVDAVRLQRALRGDIDNIVLKALEKDPSRRYASVEQFAEDLERFLAGRPVIARPQSFAYRAGKFIRRNRPQVAALVAALVLLVSIVAFYTIRLRQERDHAQFEASKAEQVAKFLTSIFEQADPDEAQGAKITAEEILAKGTARLDRELGDQPVVRAAMFDTIGRVYRTLGDYAKSEELLKRSLAEFENRAPGPSAELARAHFDLGELEHYREHFEAAGKEYERALSLYRATLGNENGETARALDLLGRIRAMAGHAEEGEKMQAEALGIRKRLFGNGSLEVAESLHSIGMQKAESGRIQEAIDLFEEELKTMEAHGKEYPALLNNLAGLYASAGRTAEAAAAYQKCLALTEKLYGPKHRFMIYAISGAADFASNSGDLEKALELFRKCQTLAAEIDGIDSASYVFQMTNVGRTLVSLRRFRDAEKVLQEAERLAVAQGADGGGRLANIHAALGRLYVDWNQLGRAEPYLRKVLARDIEKLGAFHRFVAGDYGELAKLLDKKGEYPEAERLYRKSLAIEEELSPYGGIRVALAKESLGAFLLERGKSSEAKPLLESALSTQQAAYPDGHTRVATLKSLLGACLASLGDTGAALPLARDGYEYLNRTNGADDPGTRKALKRLESVRAAASRKEAKIEAR